MRVVVWALVGLMGCNSDWVVDGTDADADGSFSGTDCNDADEAIFPGAAELCDGVDNDCDTLIDESGAVGAPVLYADRDADGFGDPAMAQAFCGLTAGWVAVSTDCDDLDAEIHPGATEADCADPVDYNCDGSVGYADADADGFAACQECDDAVRDVHPGAPEVCDTLDNDCDTLTDEPGAAGEEAWFADDDGDTYGDPFDWVMACAAPEGFVADDRDCNDSSAGAHPGSTEVCDGVDNDCDGTSDGDDAIDVGTWYADGDGDGYGAVSIVACGSQAGFVAQSGDCDDTDATTKPGAIEVCDDANNDCDALTDEGFDKVWYADADHDSFGNPGLTVLACLAPAGFVRDDTDCNDGTALAHPGAAEVCDGIDNDCGDGADEGLSTTWYRDADADSYGDSAFTFAGCTPPTGYVLNATDCNDASAVAHPGGVEVCDLLDNDCADGVDEGFITRLWFDGDTDGFGNIDVHVESCDPIAGFVSNDDDCDDTAASANPLGVEICDGLDNDCVDGVDDGYDVDGDQVTSCGGDCADSDPLRFPGATETCDALDRDCDGNPYNVDTFDMPEWFLDYDGDDHGVDTITVRACAHPVGFAAGQDDCDDFDGTSFPQATLGCDGVDHDCDGDIDNDVDGDGHADEACGGTDCDDEDEFVFPAAGGECTLGATCGDVVANGYDTGDGWYLTDPDGVSYGADPITVWCDMANGGWTYQAPGTPFTFVYTGVQQVLVTPFVTTEFEFTLYGASGGEGLNFDGGDGGIAWGRQFFAPGDTIYVYVGSTGGTGGCADCSPGAVRPGGWNGGGNGVDGGSGGGGATDIRWPGDGFEARLLVAAGGGGCGGQGCEFPGGHGGGLTGQAGPNTLWHAGGGGGTQTSGGLSPNSAQSHGQFGQGGHRVQGNDEGGGGGGWFGGAAGGSDNTTGGGGSSYVLGMNSDAGTQQGGNRGNGYAEYIYR